MKPQNFYEMKMKNQNFHEMKMKNQNSMNSLNSQKPQKPQLPTQIKLLFPIEIVHIIQSYVPYMDPPKTPSPSLQRELAKIQKICLKGKSAMYMNELDDFCLD